MEDRPASRSAGLHHAEEELRRFVDRDLLLLLAHSQGWKDRSIETGHVVLATNRVLFELRSRESSAGSLWLAFTEHAGWLVAQVHRRGWLDELQAAQRTSLDNALAGFYKMAGVDLVREQVDRHLDSREVGYTIDERGLQVWPVRLPQDVTRVAFRDWPPAPPQPLPAMLPAVSLSRPERLVFARSPVSWQRWVTIWDHDQSHVGTSEHAIHGVSLLPRREAT